jgi:hypothetical protein
MTKSIDSSCADDRAMFAYDARPFAAMQQARDAAVPK